MGRRRRPATAVADESGAASVVVALGLVGAIVALAALLAPVLGSVRGDAARRECRRRGRAGRGRCHVGRGAGVPCDLAAGVAARNGATLTGCEIDGPVASVSVQSTPFGFAVEARARAGPPGWEG